MKELLLSTINHELYNALSSIKGSAQLIQKQMSGQKTDKSTAYLADDTRKHLNYLDIILARTNQTQELLHKLMTLLSVSDESDHEEDMKRCDLVALLVEIIESQRTVTAEHTIEMSLPETSLYAVLSPFWIKRVLINLLSNAIKYSPAQTTIHVCIERQPHSINSSEHACSEHTCKEEAIISIRDEGYGIAKEYHPYIFTHSYRVPSHHPPTDGQGLGLYLCQQIIFLHGGRIWFESTAGTGSTFTFSLPLEE